MSDEGFAPVRRDSSHEKHNPSGARRRFQRKGRLHPTCEDPPMSAAPEISQLARLVREGNRRSLARALTLVESDLPEHQAQCLTLFSQLGDAPKSYRLGITGPPGAGKSTVIERLVLSWLEDGSKIAVLAIDPSSRRTGGSLLGDKTRMGRIAHHPDVFIRPSPTRQTLGGLGKRTHLMCSLLERAGYSKVIVETVGVGQSEIGARHLVDRLLLVALPGAGDDIQGIKRGLMEEVDIIAVNKADLGNSKATVAGLRSALRVFRREVPVYSVSALTGVGFDELLADLESASHESVSRPPSGEVHFFEQHTLDTVRRRLESSRGEWTRLKNRLAQGECDYLDVLPQLEIILDRLELKI